MLLASHSSHSLQPSSPMDPFPNPWGSFFGTSQLSNDRYDVPDAGSSRPDLDQQASQRFLRDEWSTSVSPVHLFPPTQDAHISPAATFLAAFTPPIQPTRLPDDEGETIAGYVLGSVIGRGGFSTIRRAASPSGGIVAIKIVRRSDVEKQTDPSLTKKRLDHETEIWSSLSHEHILPLFSAEHTSHADFYVTLYCPAGSLFDILKREGSPALPHDDTGMMFRQVVRGVRYLHEVASYVHRDIKLENVLVDEMGVCRIGDFGLTRKIGESDDEGRSDNQDSHVVHRHRSAIHHTVRQPKTTLPSHSSILRHGPRRHRTSTPVGDQSPAPVHPAHAFQPGSLPYAAPELLSPRPGKHYGANPAQDMWALGCLLYALLTGRLPFSDPFEPRLTMKILHGVFDMPSDISRGAARVLRGCIERDVRKRWAIVMVDEMAWDIGLGLADESSPVSHADECEFVDSPNHFPASKRRHSRSHSRGRDANLEPSSSRMRRSLSCTSVTTSSSLSTRSTSRSVSRPPTSAHLVLATASDDVGQDILTTATSVSSSTPLDSALMSPTLTLERGRSPRKADLRLTSRFAPSIGASTTRSDAARESSRGREMYSGTDVLDNTARWASALRLNTIAEVSPHLNGGSLSAIEQLRRIQHMQHSGESKSKRSKRAESTPPVSSAWTVRQSRACVKDDSPVVRARGPLGAGGAFLREASAAPIPIVRKNGTRSRSVGYEPDSTAHRHF